ncbi:substrate-binding periplasmic protein [Thalassotalea fusca]
MFLVSRATSIRFYFLLLSSILLPPAAHCSNSNEINFVTEHLEPYQILRPTGELSGFAIDVVRELQTMINNQDKIQVMPWARAYNTALRQPNTLIFSIARTSFREDKFHWIGSLIVEKLYVWSLDPELVNTVNSIESFSPRSIATERNSNVEQYLTQLNYPSIKRVVMETQNMKMLFRHRVDAIAGSELSLKHRANSLGLPFENMHKLFEIKSLESNLCLAFSKQTPIETVEKFRNAFQQLKQSNRFKEIQKKWQISETTDLTN